MADWRGCKMELMLAETKVVQLEVNLVELLVLM